MFVRYKKSYKKIAMGLLSFMPKMKDLKLLQETIDIYDTDPDWEIFLWKLDGDCIGLVGIEKSEEAWTVRHISVDPSHRCEGIGTHLVKEVSEMPECPKIAPCPTTEPFIEKCLQNIVKQS